MKTLIATVLVSLACLTGCDMDLGCGQGYSVQTQYTYHFGVNPATGKAGYYFGPETRCVPN